MRAVHGAEQPCADDVLALRAQIHREGRLEQRLACLVRLGPVRHDLRGERGGGPSVHDVLLGREAIRLVALRLGVTCRHVAGRVDRQLVFGRGERVGVVGLAVHVDRVPQREGHAEEALAGDKPVAVEAMHPVLVAYAHEIRMELQLLAALDKLCIKRLVGAAIAQVPLARGDDFERLVALLVEVRHAVGRRRLAVQVS